MARSISPVTGKQPRLVIVAGPPGAGKSRLAQTLGEILELPIIAKDGIKEAMMVRLGGSDSVGVAAFAVQFHVATTMLNAGLGLVLEGAFFRDQTELAAVAALGNTTVIHLSAPLDVLVARYRARQGDRHPGHRGLEAIPDLERRFHDGVYEPPDVGAPVLRVDSGDALLPTTTEIVAWIENMTMVRRLDDFGSIRSTAVANAFRDTPRHLFVEAFRVGERDYRLDLEHPDWSTLSTVYSEEALVTRTQGGRPSSSTSQPSLVAMMLELLDIQPGHRVLEIGLGTGWNAALMASLTRDPGLVYGIDIQRDVVEDAARYLDRSGNAAVHARFADGFLGWPEAAPFDRIVATVSVPDVAPSWVDQLAVGGSMLLPLRHFGANPLVLLHKEGTGMRGRIEGMSGFMPMTGSLADPTYGDKTSTDLRGEPILSDLWPDVCATPEMGIMAGGRLGFWLYLTLRDARTRFFTWLHSFGLDDEADGQVVIGPRHMSLRVTPRLGDEIDQLHADWQAAGSPSIEDFEIEWGPTGSIRESDGAFAFQGPQGTRIFRIAPAHAADSAGTS